MENRTNIIAMMTLFAAIVALGATLVSSEMFSAEKPEKPGYIVEGVEADAGAEAAAVEVPIASLLPTADPAKGAEVFKKCASCHTVNQGGAAGIGPNLYGIVGNKHAHQAGFAYSEGLAAMPGNWDFDSLNAWLKSPKGMIAGTKMSFAGLSKPEDRANVIAYMNTLGSNLPYPAAPAAAAAAPAEGAANGAGAADNAAAPANAAAAVTK